MQHVIVMRDKVAVLSDIPSGNLSSAVGRKLQLVS